MQTYFKIQATYQHMLPQQLLGNLADYRLDFEIKSGGQIQGGHILWLRSFVEITQEVDLSIRSHRHTHTLPCNFH